MTLILTSLVMFFAGNLSAARDQAAFTPDDVEAAYLFNFGKFVQWPVDRGAESQPFSICILGQDNFGKKLDDLVTGESIQQRKIMARRLSSVADADQCQIVYFGNSEAARLPDELRALEKKPVMTVSSLPLFLERGGMIQFLVENNRVRFAVNLPPARRAGLSLSSDLLKIAVYVNTKPPAEEKK
ncbi:MAG: YfiR family protein [Terracidiphilus sp.]